MEFRTTVYLIDIRDKNDDDPYWGGFWIDVFGLLPDNDYTIW